MKKHNLLKILAASAVLAGCSSNNQGYGPVKGLMDFREKLEEDLNTNPKQYEPLKQQDNNSDYITSKKR